MLPTFKFMSCELFVFICIVLFSVLHHPVDSSAVQLTRANFDHVIKNTEIVFVNFYADWCRFSQILNPLFEEAAKKLLKEEQDAHHRAVFGRVNCDEHTDVCTQNHISKYPTLKLYRMGTMAKREYRGQRSIDALADHIKKQLEDPVKEFGDMMELERLDENKRNVIGYFKEKTSPTYNTFRRVATVLRDDCDFLAGFGEVTKTERVGSDNVVYRPPRHGNELVYVGPLMNFDNLIAWATDKCNPLVREITFENAEELTEEGLPFMILFHDPNDTAIVEEYNKVVSRELLLDRNTVNFVTADGHKFSHPLHHLGKTSTDLPLIAIDSFRHMYLFPDIKELGIPGRLKQFVADLHSGKLHREFHHGPDPTQAPKSKLNLADDPPDHPTSPPESTFKKLQPSRTRYTILHDEF